MAKRTGSKKLAGAGVKKRYRPHDLVKFTPWVRPALIDECRNAVAFLSGAPEHLTLTTFVSNALRREIDRLARHHHGGVPFPKHKGELRRGARAKVERAE